MEKSRDREGSLVNTDLERNVDIGATWYVQTGPLRSQGADQILYITESTYFPLHLIFRYMS